MRTKMSLKVDEPSTGDMRHDGEVDEDKNEFESGWLGAMRHVTWWRSGCESFWLIAPPNMNINIIIIFLLLSWILKHYNKISEI